MKFRFLNQVIVGFGVFVIVLSFCGCRWYRTGYSDSFVGGLKSRDELSSWSRPYTLSAQEEEWSTSFIEEELSSLRPIRCFPALPLYVSFSSVVGFQSPFAAPFSSFSLDVDTSSYGVMKQMLSEKKLMPVKQSVRVEEYVNSFNYDYPNPQGACPIALACEIGSCPWNATNKLLRIGVQAKRMGDKNRQPCNLVFLIDVSAFMRGEDQVGMRLKLIKHGLCKLIEKLRGDDRVSIVTYADEGMVDLSLTECKNKSKIKEVINSLKPEECTTRKCDGIDGLLRAYQEAERGFDKKANNQIVLLTDGVFNVDDADSNMIENLIEKNRNKGVFLSVFGISTKNLEYTCMKRLTKYCNENYVILGNERDAERFFTKELKQMLFIIAKDVKLQLEFNPAHIASYRSLGYTDQRLEHKGFVDDWKGTGDLSAGKNMTAFYEIVPAREARTPKLGTKYQRIQLIPSEELMSVRLRYKYPAESTSKEQEFAFFERDISPRIPSTDFVFASAVAEYALLLSKSPYRGNASFNSVIKRANSAKGADADCSRAEFVLLAEKAKAAAKGNEEECLHGLFDEL